MHRLRLLLPLLLVAVASTAPAGAAPAALDADGTLYAVTAGLHGVLFAGDDALPATTPVLALDVRRADGAAERLLVPGTEGLADDTPRLALHQGGRLTLLWESLDPSRRTLHLVQWDGRRWSAVHEVHASPLATASSPAVTVGRDRQTFTLADGGSVAMERTVVHLVWQERDADGTSVRYTPLVLTDGRYVEHHDAVSLTDLYAATLLGGGATLPVGSATPTAELAAALGVRPTAGGLLVAFVDAPTGSLVTLRVESLAVELAFFADEARRAALDAAARFAAGDDDAFGDKMRAEIIGSGLRAKLAPGVVDYVAHHVERWAHRQAEQVATSEGGEAVAIAVHDLAVDLVAGLAGPATVGSHVLEIDVSSFLDGLAAEQLVDVAVIAARPIPAVGAGRTTLLASDHGALVAWEDEETGALRFVEDGGQGWSAEGAIALDDALTADRAIALLADRVE